MVVQELVALLGLEIDSAAFKKGESLLNALNTGLNVLKASAAGAAAYGLFNVVHSMTEAADAAGKMAQRTGVNTTALQELSYAAKLADVSTESLEQAMRFLAKSGVKDVKGRMLELADQMQRLPDDGTRAAFAMQHLGKMGTALIPMLKGGSEELKSLADEASALGGVFDKETIEASERFNDTLTRISFAIGGLKNRLGRALLPAFQRTADVIVGAVARIQAGLKRLEESGSLLKVLGVLLAGAATAFTLLASSAVAAALRTVLAWAASAAPFLLMAAAVTLALLVLEDLYRFFTGKGKTVIGDFTEYVKNEFGDLKTFLQAFVDWLGTSFVEGVRSIGEKIFGKTPLKTVAQVQAETGPLEKFLIGAIQTIGGDGTTPFKSAMDNPNFLGLQTPQGFVPRSQLDSNGNFTSNITINATPGMSADDIAGKVAEAQETWWDSKMRSTMVEAQ